MILIKDNVKVANLAFTKSVNKEPVSNYSLLFQNTLTKKVTTLNSIADGNNLYLKFTVDLSDLESGEYIVMLFENPEFCAFYVDSNDLKNTEGRHILYLMEEDKLLTEDDFFLVITGNEKVVMKPIKTDMLKIGDYKRNSTTYRNEQTYIQYNR